MTDDRLDLSPLDPAADQAELDALVARVVGAAGPFLAARRPTPRVSPWDVLIQWRRPILAAACGVFVVALGVGLAWRPVHAHGISAGGAVVAAALGVPTSVTAWLSQSARPPVASVVLQPGNTER